MAAVQRRGSAHTAVAAALFAVPPAALALAVSAAPCMARGTGMLRVLLHRRAEATWRCTPAQPLCNRETAFVRLTSDVISKDRLIHAMSCAGNLRHKRHVGELPFSVVELIKQHSLSQSYHAACGVTPPDTTTHDSTAHAAAKPFTTPAQQILCAPRSPPRSSRYPPPPPPPRSSRKPPRPPP